MDSPTARRAGSGGHPCQGLYHRGVGRKPKVAMIATHYQIDFSEHYLADYMATRGIGFLGWNTRFRGYREQLPAGPCPGRHRRRRALAARGSGRRNHCAARQFRRRFADGGLPGTGRRPPRDAAGGHAARRRADRPAARRRLRGQRGASRASRCAHRVDGCVRRRRKRRRSQPIPSSTCSTKQRSAVLKDFIARYRSAQVARNHAITDWAETRTQAGARGGLLRPSVHGAAHLGRSADGRPDDRADQAPGQHVLRRRSGQGEPVGARHRRRLHAAQLAGHVEPAARADPRRTAPGPHRLPRPGDQRRTGHRRLSVATRSASTTRWPAPTSRSARSTPTTTSPPRAPAARRPIRSPSGSRSGGAESPRAISFPGEKVLEFLAPETDWLDIRYCAEDDDDTFYRELPDAEVIWHVLRPMSGRRSRAGAQLRLVHKLGAGVNTIDVETATRLGIAVANMPGANAPSVAEGTVLLMLAALRRLPELDRATREGKGWPSDPASARRCATSAAARWGSSATATSPRRVETIVTAMGAECCTPAPATTAIPAGDRSRPAGRQRHRLAAPATDRRDRRHAGPRRAGPDEARARCSSTPHAAAIIDEDALGRRAAHAAGWRPRAWTCSRSSRYPPTTRCWAWTTWC